MRHLPTAALIASLAAPALAEECRLALVLAMDVSRSVDAADFALQTEGLASALESDAVQSAIFGAAGDVALAAFQWSGERHQEMLADWVLVRRPEDLAAIASAIRAARAPEVKQLTALGAALGFAVDLLETAPDCRRRVIDMAGDGQNNAGPGPDLVAGRRGLEGITVNALAIGEHEQGLVTYFATRLIHGPGAFVEVAERHSDFPRAIRRKLLRELTEELSALPRQAVAQPG
jgi:hypothetical protein